MVFGSSLRQRFALPILAAGLFACCLSQALLVRLAAQEANLDSRFAAHVSAGEFGPALELAQQATDRSRRDSMLAEVAGAQLQAGARIASLNTAAAIQNDRFRSNAFDSLSGWPSRSLDARGGAALADFDTLIELIKSTVSPDSWDDAGGPGAVEPFPTGVYVDATGTLKKLADASLDMPLAGTRRAALAISGNRDVRIKSPLRKVSLTRLERRAQQLAALGKRPDEAMRLLAGLTKVKYVFIYPESGDIVLAGPADDWTMGSDGRILSADAEQPVLRLDDLVVALRNAFSGDGRFGCSINPRRENLASVQEFLDASKQRALKPGERETWVSTLRERLGYQDIRVFGIDARTRAARILVEADYHMKLVGMGLARGTLGVTSYLDSIPAGGAPQMDVLRWWFTLNYEALRTTKNRDAFEIAGPGAKVLSENEMLAERGERVHTGASSARNQQFAASFTKHFPELAVKYPVYAELRNVFDLALVAAVIRAEDLAGQCDWHLTHFGPQGKYEVELGTAPTQVASVINYREIDRKHVVVGVSGGVSADTGSVVRTIQTDNYGLVSAEHAGSVPPELPLTCWWWD